MKTDLDHLPPHKRELITDIAEIVKAGARVEMLILFGSYARGDWVEDLVNGYFSDVDVMVVVATAAEARDDLLWSDLERRARARSGRAAVTLIVHDIKELNREIRSGQYFFADVMSEGVLLYDSRRVQLAKPKAIGPRETLHLAKRYFRYWFGSAGEFYRGAHYFSRRRHHSPAAFMLHQAAERYFHATLLVYTGYKPKTHDIEVLANQTALLHAELEGALPRSEPEDERLFKLLKRAYIEARYSLSYVMTPAEFGVLAPRVHDLAARVWAACSAKLASFCGPEAVGELPKEPDESDAEELPEAPPVDDPEALKAWGKTLAVLMFEQGEAQGQEKGREVGLTKGREEGRKEGRDEARKEGRDEGLAEGRKEEKAGAILDVLRRRGISISVADAQRILACREDATLALYWERAFSAASAAELLGD